MPLRLWNRTDSIITMYLKLRAGSELDHLKRDFRINEERYFKISIIHCPKTFLTSSSCSSKLWCVAAAEIVKLLRWFHQPWLLRSQSARRSSSPANTTARRQPAACGGAASSTTGLFLIRALDTLLFLALVLFSPSSLLFWSASSLSLLLSALIGPWNFSMQYSFLVLNFQRFNP